MWKTAILQFEEYDRRIFWSLSALLGLAVLAYLYFLSISVYAVIERKSAESEAESLSAKVSLLESEYVNLDKRITLELAHEQGFVDITVPRYISRDASHDTFTLRDATVER